MSSKEVKYSYEKINLLMEEFNIVKEKSQKIQERYTFIIPDYILEEIVSSEDKNIKDNIFALINMAVINKRITKEQGKELKVSLSKRK